MEDFFSSYSGPLAGLGFGGVAGYVVGFAAKKATKFAAILLGGIFITVQLLAYFGLVEVHWDLVQHSAENVWEDATGVTLADRAWSIISYNLPFGGGFLAGFLLGFRRG